MTVQYSYSKKVNSYTNKNIPKFVVLFSRTCITRNLS